MTAADGRPSWSLVERVARRERTITIAALAFVVAGGLWTTLTVGDGLMRPTAPPHNSFAYAALLFLMWWSMMLAMMLPSAAPAILTYGAIARKLSGGSSLLAFAAGYGAIWTGFSAAAVVLQLATTDMIRLTGMMAVTSQGLGGALLIAAGLYQLTPLKDACLRQCKPPFLQLAMNWRKGGAGAFRMGLSHGTYCLGCCFVLMLLLFYGGVMELNWIVGLALYVAAEKLVPDRYGLRHASAIVLLVWGAAVLWRAFS